VLLNAGRSPRGREFAAKHCDIAFCSAHNPRALKKDMPACCFVRFWGKADISKRMTIPFEMSSLSQRSHDNERQTSNRDGHRSSSSVQSLKIDTRVAREKLPPVAARAPPSHSITSSHRDLFPGVSIINIAQLGFRHAQDV
jgi:hypothetical protein